MLKGVSYKWNIEEYPEMEFSEEPQIGLIAQDTENVIPELVHTDSNGYKSISYEKLTAVLVEAIKAQQAQIEELKAQNEVSWVRLAPKLHNKYLHLHFSMNRLFFLV